MAIRLGIDYDSGWELEDWSCVETNDEISGIFDASRRELKALLALNNITQKGVAEFMGVSQQSLSQRLAGNRVDVWVDIAKAFPPGNLVAAHLFLALADYHRVRWEAVVEGPERELERKTADFRALIEKARKR